jgi:hypothetical protein
VEGVVSFYATVAGYIQYRTFAFLEAAVGRLQTGGWLDQRQRWRVDGRVIEHGRVETIDTDQLVLVIPPRLYRNLARITTRLFVGSTDGVVVISSTDGCFDGWMSDRYPQQPHRRHRRGPSRASRRSISRPSLVSPASV